MYVKAHDPIEELQRLRRLKRHRDIAARLQVVSNNGNVVTTFVFPAAPLLMIRVDTGEQPELIIGNQSNPLPGPIWRFLALKPRSPSAPLENPLK